MIEAPQIVQTITQDTAIIRLTVPRDEIQELMGPGIQELMRIVGAQGISVTGPWFTHHLKMSPDVFDFEISVPVSKPVAPEGRVKPSQWPAMKVARTTYHGDFGGLGDAWGEFMDWIESNGHLPAEDLWECYLVGPESSPDPSHWRTQLNRPITN